MALVLSLAFGLGVLLVYLSATRRQAERPASAGAGFIAPVEALLDRAGVAGLQPRDFLLISAVVGAAVASAALAFTGWPAVAVAAFLVGALLPTWYLHHRSEARRTELDGALADAVDALRASVRAGMSTEEGLAGLARFGPEPLRPTFGELTRDLRLVGFEEALQHARRRLATPVFDTVAAALLLAHRLGGRNLGPVLESLSRAVRGTARAEQEVRAQQARNVLSARIVAVLPLALIAAIRGLNPGYLDPFATPTGQVLLALCLLSVAGGYAAMLRAARLPMPRRRHV
ncbi:MAG: type II secretion system F family protein [Dehalococcoidia bacterium]